MPASQQSAQPVTPATTQPAKPARAKREGPSPAVMLITAVRAAWEAGVSFDQAKPILDMVEASSGVSGYKMLAETLTMYAKAAKATADAKPSA